MLKQLTKAFVAHMTPQRKKRKGWRFDYGLNVTDVSAHGPTGYLTFAFRSGCCYCCTIVGCHLWLRLQEDWDRLHACIREAGGKVGRPLCVQVRCICEGGALFTHGPRNDLPRGYEPLEKRYDYRQVFDESEAAADEYFR